MQILSEVEYKKYIKDNQEKRDTDETLRTNIQEFHLNFEQLIDETKIKKVLVCIDDLDRCSYDTVIGTLEAIKLFLFASGINLLRMSSQAQGVFRKLLNDAESVKEVGLLGAVSLSPGDASSIFEALSENVKYDGKQSGNSSTLKRLVDFCEV